MRKLLQTSFLVVGDTVKRENVDKDGLPTAGLLCLGGLENGPVPIDLGEESRESRRIVNGVQGVSGWKPMLRKLDEAIVVSTSMVVSRKVV